MDSVLEMSITGLWWYWIRIGRFQWLLSWFFHINKNIFKISHRIDRFIRCSQLLQVPPSVSYLCNEEVTRRQLSARLLHLAVTLHLKVFQVAATLHHGFYLWLYLTDVETSYSELLFNYTSNLHGLEINEERRRLQMVSYDWVSTREGKVETSLETVFAIH